MYNVISQNEIYLLSINEKLEIPVRQLRNKEYSLIRINSDEYNRIFRICIPIKQGDATICYIPEYISDGCQWISFDRAIRRISDLRQHDLLLYFWTHMQEYVKNQKVLESYLFVLALKNEDMEQLRRIPKSDLHNHVPFGGSRTIIQTLTNYYVPDLLEIFKDIVEMNKWTKANVKGKLNVPNEYKIRTIATFLQAQYDGVKVFAPNYALCARKDFDSYDELLEFIKTVNDMFSSTMEIYPELCLDRNKYDPQKSPIINWLLESGIFYSIDVTGDEKLGVEMFKENYQTAKQLGIIRKAHVGEFAESSFVENAIDTLNLNTVQHGLSIATDSRLIEKVRYKNISLTICPTSNLMLSRVKSYAEHPVRKLFDSGIDVTICSDDILLFNSSVSSEYLRLYKSGILTAFELNKIRIFGLNYYKK